MSNLTPGPQPPLKPKPTNHHSHHHHPHHHHHHHHHQHHHHPHPHSHLSNNNNNKNNSNNNNQNTNNNTNNTNNHLNHNHINPSGSNQPMKKNLRAWSNSHNHNNNSSNAPWRNSAPAQSNSSIPPHFVNGQPPTPSSNSSSSNFNSSQPQSQQQQHFYPSNTNHEDKLVIKAMHDRMVWFIMSLVGVNVTVTTKSGQRFQGLLSSAVTEAELCITLKRAVELPIPSTSTQNRPGPPAVKSTLIILAKELVEVVADDIDLSQVSSVGTGSTPNAAMGFKTDSETLGYKLDPNGQPIIREKELKSWVPSPTDLPAHQNRSNQSPNGPSDPDLMNGLEDSLFPKGGDPNLTSNNRRTFDKPWDQFEANEKLFGTRTDFDEEMYTTKLDRTGKDFKEREKKAEALAREIMASSSSNPHVQEERGGPVMDDSGMDEEDKYGAVIRSEGAYVPPGARKGAAANRGTLQPPSSSNPKQGGSLQAPQNMKVSASMPEPGPQPQAKPTSIIPPPKPSNPSKESSNSKLCQTTSTSTQFPSHPTSSHVALNLPNHNPPSRPIVAPKLSKQPEEVAPRFKAFVSDEKERLQQKKKDLIKKEKESRLADLRAFSQNFKLPMAFPKDLEPIIKKSSPANNPSTTTQSPASKPDSSKQLSSQDEAGRRASAIPANIVDRNHARHTSKPINPSNLQIVTNISTQGGRLIANPLSKPPINPSVAIGLKKLGTLAPIPPFKPRNQANNNAPLAAVSTDKKSDPKPVTQQSKLALRFANLPPIPPFKPKGHPNDSNSKDSKAAAAKVAAFNPGAKTFSPVPGAKVMSNSNATTTTPVRKSGDIGANGPANPFFGHTPIKKGSSSIHVKEEFTPFKNGNVPEASTVGPSWNFTGKSYRQIFGAGGLPPPHHHPHFVPQHPIHHPMSHHPHHHHHHHHQQQQPQQPQHMQHHVHQQHPHAHNSHGLSHPSHSQVTHMMAPPMHMQHSQQPHYSHHPPHPPNMAPQMMADDDGMSGPMNGGNNHMVAGGNGHVVNGPGMMMTGGGASGTAPGYIPHNGPGMGQQPSHPHHLPPPIPPYMYHPQHHPQQQTSISPYNGSYRQSHGSTATGGGPNGGANMGYGPPPMPVNVNMAGGPVPSTGYGSGPPPVIPVPGNPSAGPPFMGYSGSPIHPPPGSGHGTGPMGNNPTAGNTVGSNAGGPPVHYHSSPQMGALPGHGPPPPPGGIYPGTQMYPNSGDNGGAAHGPHHGHGGGGHHNHGGHNNSSGHGGGHHGHGGGGGGGGHHSNGSNMMGGGGGNSGHMGRGRGNSGATTSGGGGGGGGNNNSSNNYHQSNPTTSSSTTVPPPPSSSNNNNNSSSINNGN